MILSGSLRTKELPKTQTKVHIFSKWLPVEIQPANCKQGLGLSGESAMPPLFWLVEVLLKPAPFIMPFFFSL